MNCLRNETIGVRVERILYPPEAARADGPCFYILKTDAGTCKGRIAHVPGVGERFELDGKWEPSRYNGKNEFVFYHASARLPADERAMLRYACEMTAGFGPALEGRIWDARGEGWRRLSEADGVKGVTPARLAAFRETVRKIDDMRETSETMAWLMGIGLTYRMAESAVGKWGGDTAARVREDCYILAGLPNYGFKDVDSRVRGRFGIGRDDPRRIDACIKYYVGQLTREDTVCPWQILYDKVHAAIDSDPGAIAGRCRALFAGGGLVAFPRSRMIASPADYAAEAAVLDFVDSARGLPRVRARQPAGRGFDLDRSQMDAVQFALDRSFSVINGGAGCGKTTLIKALCESLRGDVELCAFAGKAAARLKEATGREAGTIHRMLGWQGEGRGFRRPSLAGRTVVLDEASMVSAGLMGEIVRRGPARLVLVGDEAQLPPVGSGQPFHDIIALRPGAVRTLTTCYRNREAIFSAALRIRNGESPPMEARTGSERWSMRPVPDLRDAHRSVLRAVEGGEVDFDTDIILCCRNGDGEGETECSVKSFNRDIKDIVNPNEDGSHRIAPGDRVINTKNHAELDVWNGTTGVCDRLDDGGGMWVRLDCPTSDGSDMALVERPMRAEWELAYALTVHKAQGSQYRKVFFVVSRRDSATLLSRPMVYTAVTRAKEECNVIGDVGAFYAAIRTPERKATVIQELSR